MMDTLRGHEIEEAGGAWRYADTGEPTNSNRRSWCGFCGLEDTPEGHDGCLGTLPGVMNACCGHGDDRDAYVQYRDGRSIHGEAAVLAFTESDTTTSEPSPINSRDTK